jgi:hypothetical protein
MGWLRSLQQTKLAATNRWSSLSVYRNILGSWGKPADNYSKNNRSNKYHRYNKHLSAIAYGLLTLNFSLPAYSGDVGGVSATAAPNASSSGSVINQGVQVLQGPFHTNTYGNGIQCQGTTLSITPFLTGALSLKRPYESFYQDPVYDTSDANDDGIIDNPGSVLYFKDVRTGQKDSHSITGGLSATLSVPLDKRFTTRCLSAATTQEKIQQQILANKRLDFEIARLRECSKFKLQGINFAPTSSAYSICADILTRPFKEKPIDHVHSISSDSSAPLGVHEVTAPLVSSPE